MYIMKAIYKTVAAVAVMACVVSCLASCADDIEQTRIYGFDSAGARQLVASNTDIVLDGYNEEGVALTLKWGEYDLSLSNHEYSVPDGIVSSYVEFSKSGDFAAIDTALQANGSTMDFTNGGLNIILSRKGYAKRVKSPLFARIRYVMGENRQPEYSEPLRLDVTPYGIIMDRMNVLATDKSSVIGVLYSPSENGIYQGYVAASGDWMNFYLQEKDKTVYGCVPDHAFNMSSDAGNMWNFWLQNVAGCYRVTADVNTLTWESEQILDMRLRSASGKTADMKYDRKTNTWSATVTVRNSDSFSAEASNRKYSTDSPDGTDGEPIRFDNILTISEAGTWKIMVDMNGSQPTASYVEDKGGEPVSYGAVLLMIDNEDWNKVKCRMYSANRDGKYKGFYHTVKGWENFLFATEDRTTVWGSRPGSQFVLDSSENHYALWGDEKTGLYLYYADIADNTWSQTYYGKVTVAGSFNGSDTESDPMSYDAVSGTWSADLDIKEIGWGMQILLDGDWKNCLKSKGDGVLGYPDGDNIIPPGTGRYRLTINLNDMQHLTYKFTAL